MSFDALVERGAEAAFFQDDLDGHIKGRWTWTTIPEEGKNNYRKMVRAVLASIDVIELDALLHSSQEHQQ